MKRTNPNRWGSGYVPDLPMPVLQNQPRIVGHRRDGSPIFAVAGGSPVATETEPGSFFETVESLRVEQATIRRLFDGDTKVGTRRGNPKYDESFDEAHKFYDEVMSGRRPIEHLREALSTSDFPLLFADIIDRQMYGQYMEIPPVYRNYAKVGSVRDFRTVKRFVIDGADSTLAEVGQLTEYPESALDESKFEFTVTKYGRRISLSWETIVNQDLDFVSSIPNRFARAARRTEQRRATELYVDANGPHASLFTAGNKNIINTTNGAATNNPVLSIVALQDAMNVLSRQVDAGGEPIALTTMHLVVPPALKITAENILNALQFEVTEAGGTSGQKLVVPNWMKNGTRLTVDPYIPTIATTANGHTSWFLFADPNEGRPAIEIAFLRGNEAPALFVKEPNARRIGGGTVNPEDGDFDLDAVAYKVRHVLGGGRIDGKAAVASNGSAS